MVARHGAKRRHSSRGGGRKLSRATINRCQSLVSAVFLEAVERELIEFNPSAGVKSRKRVDESDTREKWAYLTPDEQRLLFTCEAIPYEHRLMMRISIGTGMRQGEFRHLEIPDFIVDGEDPHVMIRFAGIRKKTGEKLPPKSGKKRKVQLFGDALEAAREWKAQLETYAPHNPHNLVFPTRSGAHWQQGKIFGRSTMVRGYYRLAGIKLRPHLHWHAQRHTFASNLVARAVPLAVIQKLMGHSSVTITERYAHLGEDVVASTVKALDTIEVPAINEAIDTMPVVVDTNDRGLFFRVLDRLFARKDSSHVV